MKKLISYLILFAICISTSCKKKNTDTNTANTLNSFLVGYDRNNQGVSTAVQWINGTEFFLGDTSTSAKTSIALKALKIGTNYFAFGFQLPAVATSIGPQWTPVIWKNGVEQPLQIKYLSGYTKDVATDNNNNVYVLNVEYKDEILASQTNHLILYKNDVVIFDKILERSLYHSAFLKIVNNKIYIVATKDINDTAYQTICYQDGIEIFSTQNTARYEASGLEIINNEVFISYNYE